MALAPGAVSGLLGLVTNAGGYTTIVNGWSGNITADPQDITPLSPVLNHQVLLTSGLLMGMTGSYRGKLVVNVAAAVSADMYLNPEAWMFEDRCEAREVTPLGAEWKTFVSGLITTRADIIHYLDQDTALVLPNLTGTAKLECTAGSYTIPYVVEGVDLGVDTADTERRAIIRCGVNARTAVALPLAGTVGEMVLTVDSQLPVKLTLSALITSVVTRINRRTSEGSYECGFVANGEVTPSP